MAVNCQLYNFQPYMKILLTGGGTGGHFYPLIAIAEEINRIAEERGLLRPELYYAAPTPFDQKELFDNGITFMPVSAGKRRRYISLLNFFDLFKTAWGIVRAIGTLYRIYPDVVISKGGFGAYPILWAARILTIPVIVHESDAAPGRVNIWSGTFARRVAVSWKEAAEYFPREKVAYTGHPVRAGITTRIDERSYSLLKLERKTPIILILGGSQGARMINDVILDILPQLIPKYQIIHQMGVKNEKLGLGPATVALGAEHPHLSRYHPYGFLTSFELRMAAGVASLVISRAGSAIFEIAGWGLPSIIIPITDSNGDHQRKNAYSYARSGSCVVIEEKNLTAHLLAAEIEKIMTNPKVQATMAEAARQFFKKGAATTIATEAIEISLKHEAK